MPSLASVRQRIEHDVTSPMAGSTTRNLVRMFWQNRNSIDNWPRAAILLAATGVLAPVRVVESIATRRPLRQHVIKDAPFFVVGHSRSGTTMLFRLLARDEQFGFVRFRQAVFPSMCATGRPLADRLLSGMAPDERPTDLMPVTPDEPEEEEWCFDLTSGTGISGLLYFPRNQQQYFDKWALMKGLTPREAQRWERTRDAVFRKASWLADGKRLVVKNPWNTARLPQILNRWPDAPILHIVRNPYAVYLSTWNAITAGLHMMEMAPHDEEELRTFFLNVYRDKMQAHLAQRAAVPAGQYFEIRYEDLVADPVETLRRVYDELDLGGWTAFEPRLRAYLEEIAAFTPGSFRLDRALADRIAGEWAFAFEQWGYDPNVLVGENES